MSPPPGRTSRGYRILALDVDGTLLDPGGTLRPVTARAVARAARAGIRPVLCTGRRYRRARPIAEQLGLDAPLVCNSGSLVKDPADGGTIWRADLSPDLFAEVLRAFAEHDEPPLSFTDGDPDGPDFRVARHPTGRPLFDDYVAQNREHAGIDPEWTRGADGPHFHLCAIGTKERMQAVEATVLNRLVGRVRTFVQRSPRYRGTMCEVLHSEASKWSAVLHLAALWGIGAERICAVGDDLNDVPMIAGAGLGVAMGHAPPEVLAVADWVTSCHDGDGVARLVDEVLLA
jgi:Cof subfamily protein (haloacid dehalogenase superfamily)